MSIKSCLSKLNSPGLVSKFDKLVEDGMDESLAAREVILDGHKSIHDRFNNLKSVLKLPTDAYVRPTIDAAKIESINKAAEEKLASIKSDATVKESLLSKEQTPTALRDVESTAKALGEIEKNNPSKINELVKIHGFETSELDTNDKIAKEYHEAKMLPNDVRLPEQKQLVKAVESLLSKEQATSSKSEIEAKKADIEIGKVGNTDYEVKADGVYFEGKKLDNPENKTHRQLIEADIERRRQEDLANIGIKQKQASFEKLKEAKTPKEKLNAINLIERNVAEGAILSKKEQEEIQRIKDNLASEGYEVPNILGKQFHQGMKVIVTSSIPDETLAEGEEIITKVLAPQVNKDDKMVQTAQIEVTVGTKKGGLTRDQWLAEQKKKETRVDKINAKYDAELKALGQQPTTSNQSEIEAKKAAPKKEALQEKKKPELKPKEKSGKLSVGQQIPYGGSTWTVTSIGKNRIGVTNGSVKTSYDRAVIESMISGDNGDTKPTLKPKKRFSEKDISDVVDHYNVSESAAVEILDAISSTKDKNALAKKIDQIISGDQQTSIKAPLKGGEVVSDEDLASVTPSQNIIQATSDFEGKPHTALANSTAVSFNQAHSDLKNDGRVQMDGDVENVGLSDGKYAVDENQSLFDIMTGDNTGRQRGIAAAYIAAHRMISDKNSPLVALFSKVGKRIRIINSNIFNVYDQKGKFVKRFDSRQEAEAFKHENPGFRVDYPPIMAAQEDGTLVLNAHMLNERLEEFWGEKRFFNWMEMALYEEAIHLTQMQTATEMEMNQIFGEMSSEEKELVADKYGVRVADLSKFQMASEYVRMIVQNNLFGTTTEMLKPKRAARNYLSKILGKLLEYFGGKKDRITDQVVARIEETVRGTRNESLPKIKSVEKLVSEKPRISLLEDGVGGPIYKVQYKNYQFAVGQGMSRAGQVFYEVEKIKGEWVPKELLGSNPSEALVALKYRVDQNRGLGTSIGELGAASLDDWFFTGDLGVRQRNLQVARKMRESGIGEIAVKLATGWELGGDGKWRYEIADDQIEFSYQRFKESKPGKEFKLYEILNHPELYKAYPFIKGVRVISEAGTLFDGVQGYVSVAGEIGLSLNAINPESTLLHEIQHLIQRVEGFAKGGNSSTYYQMMSDNQIFKLAADNAIALVEENDRLISKIKEYEDFQDAINMMSDRDKQWAQDVIMSLDNIIHLSKKRQSVYERINNDKAQFKSKPAGWSVNDHPDMVNMNEQIRVNSLDLVDLLNQSVKEFSLKTEFNDSIVNEMWASRLYEKASLKDIFYTSKAHALSEYDANKERAEMYKVALSNKDRDLASRLVADDNADSYKMYKRLAGEVEARNTQKRQSMSADERRESLLADTEDVAEEDKIYLMDSFGIEKAILKRRPPVGDIISFIKENLGSFFYKQKEVAEFVDILKKFSDKPSEGVDDLSEEERENLANTDLGEIITEDIEDYNSNKTLISLGESLTPRKYANLINEGVVHIHILKNMYSMNTKVSEDDVFDMMADIGGILNMRNKDGSLNSNVEYLRHLSKEVSKIKTLKDFFIVYNKIFSFGGVLEEIVGDRKYNELRTSQSDNFDDEFLNKKYEEFHGKEEAPTGADPIGDYVMERGKDIISEVGYTHLKRMAKEADKGDVPDLMDYEVPSMKLAQAEWDIGEIVSKVFTDYEFGSALDYFVDKIKDSSVATPVRMILARKLIEKFEGRPDIARFIRIKLDLPLGNEAGRALLARRDWGTRNTGNPRDNKTAPAAPSTGINTRGLWGRDLSEDQENIITATVPGASDIIQAKAALEDAQDNSVDSEVEETLGMMLDQSEERVAELEAEIKELRDKVKNPDLEVEETLGMMLDEKEGKLAAIKKQADAASKLASKASKEFSAAKSDAALARLQKRWKSKNPVKELKDLINKIAKSCSA